jgi:hypothetical protein
MKENLSRFLKEYDQVPLLFREDGNLSMLKHGFAI